MAFFLETSSTLVIDKIQISIVQERLVEFQPLYTTYKKHEIT